MIKSVGSASSQMHETTDSLPSSRVIPGLLRSQPACCDEGLQRRIGAAGLHLHASSVHVEVGSPGHRPVIRYAHLLGLTQCFSELAHFDMG